MKMMQKSPRSCTYVITGQMAFQTSFTADRILSLFRALSMFVAQVSGLSSF